MKMQHNWKIINVLSMSYNKALLYLEHVFKDMGNKWSRSIKHYWTSKEMLWKTSVFSVNELTDRMSQWKHVVFEKTLGLQLCRFWDCNGSVFEDSVLWEHGAMSAGNLFLTFLSDVQPPSSRIYRPSSSQEILHILWNWKFHYLFHKSLPFVNRIRLRLWLNSINRIKCLLHWLT
jgi:hypothetical protein